MSIEIISIKDLKPHERNYNYHPEDQLEHIIESIKANGIYRNIVVARDNTILAGHGVVQAASQLGHKEISVFKVDLDPGDPRAIRILIADNEIGRLSNKDDEKLIDLLKEIQGSDPEGLLGTGFDDMMLSNLETMAKETDALTDFDPYKEWEGMPEYDNTEPDTIKTVILFRSLEDKLAFGEKIGVNITEKSVYAWWPYQDKHDTASIRFEDE